MEILGVDIGGTSIKIGVVDTEQATIRDARSIPTPMHGAKSVADAIAANVGDWPGEKRLGVGVPGAMNRDRSLVRYPPNLTGWREEPLRALLEASLTDWKIDVDNDAKVAGLAEAKLGAGRGLSHFMMVTLGTGVGGCVYLSEGSFTGIARGASGGAGEFGHLSIDLNGPECGCGSRGCIEAYLGQRYLSERTRKELEMDPSIHSTLRAATAITPKAIADAMNAGDEYARRVFVRAGDELGAALASVANLLDISSFIIGGGVAEAGSVLLDSALSTLQSRALANLRPLVEIRKAHFGNTAGMIGAALLVA